MKTSTFFWLIIAVIFNTTILATSFSLYAFKENLVESRKYEIATVLQFAQAQASIYVEKVRAGRITREEAEEEFVRILSATNQGSDYVWANDSFAIARVHIRDEVIGTFQESYTKHLALLTNKEIIFDISSNVKPISDKRVKKINGITKIPYWNWIVGYGVYMDEVNQKFHRGAVKSVLINIVIISLGSLIAFLIRRR
jgi:methyl-accepting chemotaxis protein